MEVHDGFFAKLTCMSSSITGHRGSPPRLPPGGRYGETSSSSSTRRPRCLSDTPAAIHQAAACAAPTTPWVCGAVVTSRGEGRRPRIMPRSKQQTSTIWRTTGSHPCTPHQLRRRQQQQQQEQESICDIRATSAATSAGGRRRQRRSAGRRRAGREEGAVSGGRATAPRRLSSRDGLRSSHG